MIPPHHFRPTNGVSPEDSIGGDYDCIQELKTIRFSMIFNSRI